MKRARIPLSGSQQGLASPFAALSIEGLPPGPEPEPAEDRPAPAMRLVLRREKSHRNGKTVVIVSGFPPAFSDPQIEALATDLRKSCGTGGTVKDREIEIQGDQPDRIRTALTERGHRVVGP